jgi:hypothetical protein
MITFTFLYTERENSSNKINIPQLENNFKLLTTQKNPKQPICCEMNTD